MLNFHIIASFPNFFLLLTSDFTPLWLGKILCMTSILLNVLRFVYSLAYCPSWKIPCWFRRMDILLLSGRVFCRYVRSSLFIKLFKSSISLLILCLVDIMPCCSIHYWKWDTEISNCYCWIICFFHNFCQFLLHVS